MILIEVIAALAGWILNATAVCCYVLNWLLREKTGTPPAVWLLFAAGFTSWSACALMAGVWWWAIAYGPLSAASAWAWFRFRRGGAR